VEEVDDADMVLTLRSHMNKGYQRFREAKAKNVPIKNHKEQHDEPNGGLSHYAVFN